MKATTVKNKLGNFVSVENLTSSNGNDVPNQFNLRFENGKVFQSYNSLIAIKIDGKVYLGKDWNYSKTTMKYLNWWLGGYSKKEIEKGIKEGEFILLKD